MINETDKEIKVYFKYQGLILTGKYIRIEDNYIYVKVDGHETTNGFNLHSVVKLESINNDMVEERLTQL